VISYGRRGSVALGWVSYKELYHLTICVLVDLRGAAMPLSAERLSTMSGSLAENYCFVMAFSQIFAVVYTSACNACISTSDLVVIVSNW